MKKVVNHHKIISEELVSDLKLVGTTLTKNTIGNTLWGNGLKSRSARKVLVFKKPHVQACLFK